MFVETEAVLTHLNKYLQNSTERQITITGSMQGVSSTASVNILLTPYDQTRPFIYIDSDVDQINDNTSSISI